MAETTQESRALEIVDEAPAEIVEANPDAVVSAFKNYQAIQVALDKALGPNSIQKIQGKPFRKKVYWRAIATAFNLQLDLVDERREEAEGDWGYLVTYRATAGNGRHCDGDGACFVSEKRGAMATVHNVRAHAHTRAKNRAIADLVGFGEVSAEEVNYEPAQSGSTSQAGGSRRVTEKQRNFLKAKCYERAKVLSGKDDQHELAGSIGKAAKSALGVEENDYDAGLVDALVSAISSIALDRDGNTIVSDSPEDF